jgi:hypothetical protein
MKTTSIGFGLLVVFAFFGMAQPVRGEAFTITEWALGTTVYDSSIGGPEGLDSDYNNVVENPFQHTQFASVGISTAETTYDFAWSADFGGFLIDAAHEAEDIDTGTLYSRSSGYIWVAPSIDLSLEIAAAYSYYLPPGMMLARLEIFASDVDTSENLFYAREQDNSFDGYPVSGTFTIDGNATLPAGHTIVLHYEMIIQSFSGQTGLLGTGTGSVSFTLQPVPEPSTLALLATFILIVPRRRHRRS